MAETDAHRRAKNKAAGARGKLRVPLPQGNRVNGSLCDEACAEVVVPGGDLSAES